MLSLRDFNYIRPGLFDPNLTYSALDDMARSGFENLGSSGNQVYRTTSTADLKINAQGGDDVLLLGSGDNEVYAGSGHDEVYFFGSGNNLVFAGTGNDTVSGGGGDDTFYGGSGNDELWGDNEGGSTPTGNDVLNGGSGIDRLVGGLGGDEMSGGTGQDTFIFRRFDESRLHNRDEIKDFNRAEGDKIDLSFMTPAANRQDFEFVSDATGQVGTVYVEGSGTDWTVFVDVNGGGADMAMDVTLAGGATSLTAGDFIL